MTLSDTLFLPSTDTNSSLQGWPIKGKVHLIFKLHLKVVFLSMKYNDAISFGHSVCFLTQSEFLTPKNKREIPKIMPDYPKNVA